jgi:alpha-beta hydrolase superfamily lysophospholipase
MQPSLLRVAVSVLLAACGCTSGSGNTWKEVTVTLGPDAAAWSLPATLLLPRSAAAVPCVVFFAGSGPTDRNWLSPLLAGRNGSGQQLAEGLASKGIGSLRFAKVGSGANMDHLDALSLAHYVEEGTLAFDFLAARPECSRVFLLGHSEGALHATATAVSRQSAPRFGGLILMAGYSRSMLETAVGQIHRLHARTGDDIMAIDATLRSFDDAVRSLPGSTPPDLSRAPEAAGLWTAATDPRLGSVVRELLLADPLGAARAHHGPVLVLAAGRDAQVETMDADRLLDALGSPPESKRRAVIAEANHVFEREDRDPAQLSDADVAAGYAAEGHPLAGGTVDEIATFVQANRR